jgi:hypothetical protein
MKRGKRIGGSIVDVPSICPRALKPAIIASVPPSVPTSRMTPFCRIDVRTGEPIGNPTAFCENASGGPLSENPATWQVSLTAVAMLSVPPGRVPRSCT